MESNDQTMSNRPPEGPARAVGAFLFWSVVFGLAYTQAPLYYSNQNQYFLHGLARGGWGHLDRDWLANTGDPTPVFSALVAVTYRFLHEGLFYVYYLLILGLYFHSSLGIFTLLTKGTSTPLGRLAFITLFAAVHAGLVRLASAHSLGVDYPWYAQAGVAGQYLLGFGLQPSVSGVFLLASIHAFFRERPWFAIVWACLAGILHGTYLLAAAMLVLAYLFLQWRRGRARAAFAQGVAALALVAPVVVYNFVAFAPSSPQEFGEAQSILAHFRIPHHAEPERWFDAIALAQVAWILIAMVLVRRTPLFAIVSIPFALSLLLTLVQVVTANDTLALLFPWRTSAILVPLATTIMLATFIQSAERWLRDPSPRQAVAVKLACGLTLALLAAGGVAIFAFDWGYRTNPSELPMMEYVRTHKSPGDVYLLPVSLPTGPGPRGAFSTNFTPAPRAGKSGHLIAIDLQRFRIVTGAPIFVDFKSIPYKDTEVLEWHRRLLWAEKMYADRNWNRAEALDALRENGITHVVATTDRDIDCSALQKLYEDDSYRVYRLAPQK